MLSLLPETTTGRPPSSTITTAPTLSVWPVNGWPMGRCLPGPTSALLIGNPAGVTSYSEADVRDPASILTSAEVREKTLDLTEPTALLLIAVMHFAPDDEQAYRVVSTLVDALPRDSYLALTSATDDVDPETGARVREQDWASGVHLRTPTLDETTRRRRAAAHPGRPAGSGRPILTGSSAARAPRGPHTGADHRRPDGGFTDGR